MQLTSLLKYLICTGCTFKSCFSCSRSTSI
jgi:hypothetical protein